MAGRPPLTFSTFVSICKQTWQEWNDDEAPRHGAALAFYAILSIGPLLLIVIAVAGFAFGHDSASGYLIGEMRRLIGSQGAQAIEDILKNSQSPAKSLIATGIGIVTLIISATGFFSQLQIALNTMWNVPKEKSGLADMAKKRLLSFGLVGGICLLLLFSLVVSAALAAFTHAFNGYLPDVLLPTLNVVVSFVVTTLLFAMVFKILPDVRIRWRDTWVGALITALLFAVGKYLIGLYLGRSAFASTYGAAGSLIVLLVWIYYSAQIFFFGAEFTQVYVRAMGETFGSRHARKVAEAATGKQGPSAKLMGFIEEQTLQKARR